MSDKIPIVHTQITTPEEDAAALLKDYANGPLPRSDAEWHALETAARRLLRRVSRPDLVEPLRQIVAACVVNNP